MTAQLVVGPHSSSSLIRSNSVFTVEEITVNNLNVTSDIDFSGDLLLNSLGVTTDINVNGVYNIDSIEVLSGTTLGSGVVNSSLTSVGDLTDLTILGDLTVDTDTLVVDSTNNNVGINNSAPDAAYVLDVLGDTNFDGGVTISGDLNVLGGITSTFSTIATVQENFLKLATDNTNDLLDTGIYNLYNDGTTRFAGYTRDATDGVFKFFQGTTEEPSTTIDFTNPEISFADILVNNLEAFTIDITSTANIQELSVTGDFIVDTNTLFVNTSTDRIGVNTSTPSYELDVSGDVNITNEYRINGTSVLTEDTLGTSIVNSSLTSFGTLTSLEISGDLIVDTDTLFVNSVTDRVGVNTATPSYSFDVVGDINASTNYKVGGIQVLDSTTLGSGIVNSSLTSLGNLVDLTVDTDTFIVDGTTNHVGIGITDPDEPLHIYESSFSGQQLHIENPNASGSAGIEIDNDGSTGNLKIQQTGDNSFFTNFGGNMSYLAKDTGVHSFFTTDSDTIRFKIQNDGDIGIGNNTPSYRLDVSGGDINVESTGMYRIGGDDVMSSNGITSLGDINFNSTTRFEQQGGNIYISTTDTRQFEFNTDSSFVVTNGNIGINVAPSIDLAIGTTGTGLNAQSDNELAIYTSGVEAVRIDSAGLVGLNNTNPVHQLDVAGSINFTGTLYQNGSEFLVSDGIWTQNGDGGYVTLGGNMGIGTSSPSVGLEIAQDDNTNGQLLVKPVSTTSNDAIVRIQGARNSSTSEYQSQIIFENYDNDLGSTKVLGRISGMVTNDTTNLGDLVFATSANGTGFVDRMTIAGDGDIDIVNDLTVNEVLPTVCSSIGSLGYILLDELSTSALSLTDFSTHTLDLDNQSTSDFAMYKLIVSGRIDGNGGIPFIQARFSDLSGEISTTNGYQTTVVAWGGGSINNTRLTSMYIVNIGSATAVDFNYTGDYTISLGATSYNNRIIGQHSLCNDSGTSQFARNVTGNLTSLHSLDTRVTTIGFQGSNINSSGSRDFAARLYRLL